ncbi:DUF7768 domain-containing protein [Clostridium perfringens]|uniref:DUF7768 domain-containing protein n=1 Tax=Clostridium perfringens TaxID=1502 RepID=UPI0018E41B6D|nr:DUF4406 domain-containing protein [Clostridium perfringens]MBI5994030.1 DUF4406 domain-containing protein [Clostridium perfringens]MBI5999902.1 DUF4406 domain-containing protein [Clostridium perfringens]MDK0567949.1 DUF4406 domain-containing protein [Clostridium perfringens]
MGISKYNSEGYYDPVPQMAVNEIEKELHKWRPLVYICSPFSGDIEGNTQRARAYSRFAVDQGAVPLAPHLLLPQFMSEKTERDLALFMDIVFLGRCEQLWVFGKNISSGMAAEIDKAKQKKMKIRYFTEECQEVSKDEED